jgi:hypothetical protein
MRALRSGISVITLALGDNLRQDSQHPVAIGLMRRPLAIRLASGNKLAREGAGVSKPCFA